jgi:SAM-dependent methyltransferase
MVDERTLDYYDEHAQPVFDRFIGYDRAAFHARLLPYLNPGGLSADIGSGSGADLAWLNAIGCPAIGYEPASGLRRLAMRRYVDLDIRSDFLPDLSSVKTGLFQNVLCMAVLMHLPAQQLPAAVQNLSRIMAPSGRLIVSWRPTEDGELREANGRLFSPITIEHFRELASDSGLGEIATWDEDDAGRPGLIRTHWVGLKS